jgi:hypothetical protein
MDFFFLVESFLGYNDIETLTESHCLDTAASSALKKIRFLDFF